MKTTPKKIKGRPKLNKITISIRISPDVWTEVREAAAIGGNLSAYVEDAVKTKLQRSN